MFAVPPAFSAACWKYAGLLGGYEIICWLRSSMLPRLSAAGSRPDCKCPGCPMSSHTLCRSGDDANPGLEILRVVRKSGVSHQIKVDIPKARPPQAVGQSVRRMVCAVFFRTATFLNLLASAFISNAGQRTAIKLTNKKSRDVYLCLRAASL